MKLYIKNWELRITVHLPEEDRDILQNTASVEPTSSVISIESWLSKIEPNSNSWILFEDPLDWFNGLLIILFDLCFT